MKYLFVLAALLWTLPLSTAQATIRYVTASAASCSNPSNTYTPESNTCGGGSSRVHVGQAAAIHAAVDESTAGDEIHVMAGTYDMSTPSTWIGIKSNTTFKATGHLAGAAGSTTIVFHAFFGPDANGHVFNIENKSNITISGSSSSLRDLVFQGSGPGTGCNPGPCQGGGGDLASFRNNTNIVFENLEVAGGFFTAFAGGPDSSTLTFRNLEIHRMGRLLDGTRFCDAGSGYGLDATHCHGFYAGYGWSDVIIENILSHDHAGYGIECIFNIGDGSCGNTIIRNSRLYDNAGPGMFVQAGDSGGARIYNNLIYRNGTDGIAVNATGALIYNNTIVSNGSGGICTFGGATGIALRNNIVVGNTSFQINSSSCHETGLASGVTLQTNVTTGTPASHFAAPANSDFRPCTDVGVPHDNCPAASSAVGAGTNLSAIFTTDINGSTRDAPWDIGAYKAGAETPGAPSPLLVIEIACDNAVTDSSGNANHGTLTNGATYNASGKYNQACSFDGTNDYISIANSATLDQLTHGFTISLWVKMTAGATTLKYLASNDGKAYLGASSSSLCGAGGIFGGFEQGGSATNACHSAPLTTDWTHLAITYNSQSALLTLYKNGSSITSTSASAVLDAATGAFRIGSGVDEAFTAALIDEIRVYNYARNASQVITDRDTPINSLGVPASPFLTIGAAASALKLGAGATVFKLQGAQ